MQYFRMYYAISGPTRKRKYGKENLNVGWCIQG